MFEEGELEGGGRVFVDYADFFGNCGWRRRDFGHDRDGSCHLGKMIEEEGHGGRVEV